MTSTRQPKELLDSELASLIEPFAWITYNDETIPEMRQLLGEAAPESTGAVERSDVIVAADLDIVVRVHRPWEVAADAPAILSMHGGGYVIGNRNLDDQRLERMCSTLGCIGFSVEYRLAPEHPYPAPLEDCYTALRWLFEHADDLGVDRSRIGVTGVSAGGGLAASLALLARDLGEFRLAFQALECPMLDDRQRTPSSQLDGLPMWSREANAFGWRSYLGPRYGTTDVPAYAAPARARDLAGVPPTFISVGALDGFRDEDVEFATRLYQAGVPTDLHVHAGAPHGFHMFAGTALADRANDDLDRWLAAQLARSATAPSAAPEDALR
ncbi:MAG: hypothetical protein QOE63_108 [Acidimicrobiaceae bacterium]